MVRTYSPFALRSSENAKVLTKCLFALVPPHQILVYDASGRDVAGAVGPLFEGDNIVLTCEVRGGKFDLNINNSTKQLINNSIFNFWNLCKNISSLLSKPLEFFIAIEELKNFTSILSFLWFINNLQFYENIFIVLNWLEIIAFFTLHGLNINYHRLQPAQHTLTEKPRRDRRY